GERHNVRPEVASCKVEIRGVLGAASAGVARAGSPAVHAEADAIVSVILRRRDPTNVRVRAVAVRRVHRLSERVRVPVWAGHQPLGWDLGGGSETGDPVVLAVLDVRLELLNPGCGVAPCRAVPGLSRGEDPGNERLVVVLGVHHDARADLLAVAQ